jgi:uncharacterized damage-inducible protein DinB
MSLSDGARLAELSQAVRESTVARLPRVGRGFENWRPGPDAMSFADIARHLVDADEWLFKKLRQPELAPIKGEAGLIDLSDFDKYLDLITELERIGGKRTELLAGLSDSRLSELIFDARFNGEVSIWWLIVRGNLDHETHHRGQIAAFLRILNL